VKTFCVLAVAIMLLVTGCAENANRTNRTNMQQMDTAQDIRMDNPAHSAAKLPIMTQASSTATVGVSQSSLSINQAPYVPNWCIDNQLPAENPATPASPISPTIPDNPGASIPAEPTSAPGQFEQQVLQMVNKQRASSGQAALVMDNNLARMAMVKAQDMYDNNYFDHNSPTYGSPFDMMDKFQISYSSAGENIAKGQTSAEQVMNDWMNSPGHRANILNSGFTKIGVAHYNGAWVQEFIS
jgi:uncharacterized YkwD family protein